ncbi:MULTISPECIES: peptidase U32 family protein [Geobacillus]|jgi:U32 family peptidase|uniref:Protease n=2 Tax=Geobacillus thermodenitrificans TaxID=33940 RepID=A4IR74_GEOTN|nr:MULTISPECIES: peptidase U32 family protein [Geobacillus]ABO67828.1 Protease [Geobacillus thermodenitrificans NG80-2]ARA98993.1 peptidase U32 [Geobacillus thermodenitrificans]ARP43577.1 putative protease YrrO [Geobacillus thermodenitrificans]ATO38360.1 peptidase U32 [Geobacillus thermodenitrificans]KQB92395.1 putative protease YrrN [Geobacillus sp. PA-3]
MKKPELLVTPTSVSHIDELAKAGADAVIVGEQRYGLRLAGEFSRTDVAAAVEAARRHGMNVYVAMNAIFHNDKVDELADYVAFVADVGADAIVFGDPAVLLTVRETAPHMKLHWSTETTATNWYTCNYWGRKGAKRAVLARELNMDAILEIKAHAEVEIEVQVHGMTCMYQSKRSLIGNYFEYQGKVMEIERKKYEKGMFLYDKERDHKYPIFEDENGTHIMSPNDLCIIDELGDMVNAGIDSFKIDGILHEPGYITEVTKLYRHAIDLCADDRERYEKEKDDLLAAVEALQPPHRRIDTGFFFKETIY